VGSGTGWRWPHLAGPERKVLDGRVEADLRVLPDAGVINLVWRHGRPLA